MAATFGGGGGTVSPNIFSNTKTPRFTGEVVVPFAVVFKMLAWVRSPPRMLVSGSENRFGSDPNSSTFG
jgi:hypothetical protein